jgi:protocatechuate 3,4-dioxygenase beta subunit
MPLTASRTHPTPSSVTGFAAAAPDHGGLWHDLVRLGSQPGAARLPAPRRDALRWLAALGLTACGGGEDVSATTDTGSGSGSSTGAGGGSTGTVAGCSAIPEETAGPYPGDGSNTANGSVANALALSGIVRSDIRTSVATASGTATGVPLQVVLTLVNSAGACAALEGFAIYLWHCDRLGRYSMYSSGVTGENHLRGVQATDANGQVSFSTIFPGCYDGRVPHMHFEIFRSLGTATGWTNKLRTSQLTFPTDVCRTVYASADGYTNSASNFARTSVATDNVFSDGVSLQLASVEGSVSTGYVARLSMAIAA